MEENYIHIYSVYMAELLQEKKADLKRVYEMMKLYVPFLETVKSRGELIVFVDQNLGEFRELQDLKVRLEDPNYQFSE